MATSSLNGVNTPLAAMRYSAERNIAKEKAAAQDAATATPGLANVVQGLDTIAPSLAHNMRIELDMGEGKLGARVINNTGVIHPVPLQYVASLSGLVRESGIEPRGVGSQVDEMV